MLTTHINVECSVNRAGTIDVMVVSPALSTELFIMIDYVWKRFWRLLVLEEVERVYTKSRPNWFRRLLCECECWEKTVVYSFFLWKLTKSCWCLQKERVTKTWVLKDKENWTHPMYNARNHFKNRCGNKNDKRYKDYWWRWITVCKEWSSFENFYEDMKEWREKWLTIDRIDNDWNYCKSNCRRATWKVQANNKRNTTKHCVSAN